MTEIPARVRDAVDVVLDGFERTYDAVVIAAVEHGSRAWGYADDESDYDVQAVYTPADLRAYVRLATGPETVHVRQPGSELDLDVGADGEPIDDAVDVELTAWPVPHFLELLVDSNDGAIDVLRSPIRYRERVPLDPLASYVTETYDPMSLYHAWRGMATNNYRQYLSHHLVDGEDRTYPIVETTEDAYRVRDPDGGDELRVDRDDPHFDETATDATVKRNLVVVRAAMYARYLRRTGERGDHELPNVRFPAFLDEQAPDVFDTDRIETARSLLDRKRRGEGDAVVGDRVGREFAQPPREIDPEVHARTGPDPERLDVHLDRMLAVNDSSSD